MKRKKPAAVANDKSAAGASEKTTAIADEKPTVDPPARELTARERPIFEKFREAHTTAGTRMKLVKDGDKPRLVTNHDNEFVGKLLLADALGAADLDFSDGLISQLTKVGTQDSKVDLTALNFMLSVVKSIKPKDQVEAMLAAQMAGIHMATMRMMQRLADADNIPKLDSTERALNKLARTFAGQMEALKRYRTGGEQKITVQRVSVRDGGQAIVGNVTQAATENTAEQVAQLAPQLTHAKETPLTILGAEALDPEPEPIAVPPSRAKLDGEPSA